MNSRAIKAARALISDLRGEARLPGEDTWTYVFALETALNETAPISPEVDALKKVINDANAELFDTRSLDVEHDISSHADTLPDRYRRVAGGHERALEILQGPIREWVEGNPTPIAPSPSEKPLPDAPGVWLRFCPGDETFSRGDWEEMIRITPGPDGELMAYGCQPVSNLNGSRWYGPMPHPPWDHDRPDCPCGHPPGTLGPCAGCNCADYQA